MGLRLGAIIGMVGTIPLGVLSLHTRPELHAASAPAACVVSVTAHVSWRGGGYLGASLLLGLGVMLGLGVRDGVVGPGVHAAVAAVGGALPGWVHLGQPRGAARPPRPAPGPSASS